MRTLASEEARKDEIGGELRIIVECIIQVGKLHPEAAKQCGVELFYDQCPALQEASLSVLKHFPCAEVLEKLWTVHKANAFADRTGQDVQLGERRRVSRAALISCVNLDLSWLEKKIADQSEDTTELIELALLVANISGMAAKSLWRRVKQILYTKIPADKSCCLIYCIRNYADIDEIERLEAWAESSAENLTREHALATLVHLAPKRALRLLPRFEYRNLYMIRGWWLPGLLLRVPIETRDQLFRRIKSSASTHWNEALVYQGYPNQMDEKTLDVLLDKIENLIRQTLVSSAKNENSSLFTPLDLLASVTRFDLLLRFEARA